MRVSWAAHARGARNADAGIPPKQQQHEEAVQGACIETASRQAGADKPQAYTGPGVVFVKQSKAKRERKNDNYWNLICLSGSTA